MDKQELNKTKTWYYKHLLSYQYQGYVIDLIPFNSQHLTRQCVI